MSGGDRDLLIWFPLLSSCPLLLSGAASDRLQPHPAITGVWQELRGVEGVLFFLTEPSLESVS